MVATNLHPNYILITGSTSTFLQGSVTRVWPSNQRGVGTNLNQQRFSSQLIRGERSTEKVDGRPPRVGRATRTKQGPQRSGYTGDHGEPIVTRQ